MNIFYDDRIKSVKNSNRKNIDNRFVPICVLNDFAAKLFACQYNFNFNHFFTKFQAIW